MNKFNKAITLGLSTFMILGNLLCVDAATYPALNQKRIKGELLSSTNDDANKTKDSKCHKPCARRPMLKESVDQLQKSGVLSEDDVKNIDTFMKKEREAVESEIQEKIYKEECSKIDKMVSEKVISKDQGDKLKAAVKENLESCK